MIHYNYNVQVQPPAPFVHLVLQNPVDGRELRNVPAQIDTAADRTVLPISVVQALGLQQLGILTISGLGGTRHTLSTYWVALGIHDLPLQPYKVVANADEPWVLLGRDVLKSHRLLLDGPQAALEIG